MNLIDFNKISQIPHIQPKNVYTLESCSHGGIFSTENHLKVKIDFSSNINPLGISGQVLKEIRKSLTAISHIYPDPDCCLLRKGIADYIQHGIDPDWINVGNGATELIHTFVRAVSLKNSIILSPTFCEYELASKRCGMKIENISLSRRFEIEPDLIIEKSKIKPKNLIFICNPNNPTGLVETERIEKIICSANPSTILFIDESFIEFLENVEKKSLVSKIKEFDNVAILRSMTKAYGLAGLRLGYLVANPKIIQKLKKKSNILECKWNSPNCRSCCLK